MSVRQMLRNTRAKVTRQGPLTLRRLRRPCPDCGHVSTYCAERRFCGERGFRVCVDAVCIACGFEGSVSGDAKP